MGKLPTGAAVHKGLTFRMGQLPARRYLLRLLEHVQRGNVNSVYLLTHRMPLKHGAEGYQMLKDKTDNVMRVVFEP